MMPPLNPIDLLKALSPLLSERGGIKGMNEVAKSSNVMKKFAKKLVSRCIYVNVLKETEGPILDKFLNEEGWDTLNQWIQDARDTDNASFLIELLQLCHNLPMTLERLKQNNTAKLVKTLTKFNDPDVKVLAEEVVGSWMNLIKTKTNEIAKAETSKVAKKDNKEKDKKKKVKSKESGDKKDNGKDEDQSKVKAKIIRIGRNFKEVQKVRAEDLEDVKPMPLQEEPVVKKPKLDRPKTVKTLKTKFRLTGLEEAPAPPPSKKSLSLKNKPPPEKPVVAPKLIIKRIPPSPDKKIKASYISIQENLDTPKIPEPTKSALKFLPKPKPQHVIHESSGFMDAMITSAPTQPLIRKRKKIPPPTTKTNAAAATAPGSTPPTPTTPTTPPPAPAPPKLQFYKDTLEMNENEEKDSDAPTVLKEIITVKDDESEKKKSETEDEKMDTTASKSDEIVLDDEMKSDDEMQLGDAGDFGTPSEESSKPMVVKSILSHGKKKTKKSVRFNDEKKIYYFELDENERVNVNHIKNFANMKEQEMKRERQAFESAKRLKEDKMEEFLLYTRPKLITPGEDDLIVQYGINSTEKVIQKLRQELTLQEIYFSKDMIPDSPYEPDPETVVPQEPKIIPLEDVSNPGGIIDYTNNEQGKASLLPSVLSELMNSLQGKLLPVTTEAVPTSQPMQIPNDVHPDMQSGMQPQHMMPGDQGFSRPMGQMGFERPGQMGPMGDDMQSYGLPDGDPNMMDWQQQSMDNYDYGPGPGGYNQGPRGMGPPQHMNGPRMGMPRGGPRMGGPPREHWRGRGGPPRGGPPRGGRPPRGGGPPRGGPPRGGGPQRGGGPPRIPCKFFMSSGNCRFGSGCNYLHPGVNGPPL